MITTCIQPTATLVFTAGSKDTQWGKKPNQNATRGLGGGGDIIQNKMPTYELRRRHENKELFYQMCRVSKVCKFVCTNDLWS